MACVYALSSSLGSGDVRYIGRCKEDNGKSRLVNHLCESRRGVRSHKNSWIRSVTSAGGEIVSTVLESGLSWGESTVREIFYIAHYRSLGHRLTNMTDGGEGSVGYVPSAEHRAKTSAAGKGKTRPPRSAEWCARIGAANLGSTRSTEARERMRKKGMTRTPVTHCKWGHEFTEENTYRYGRMRQCRACSNARHRNDYNNNKNTMRVRKGDE